MTQMATGGLTAGLGTGMQIGGMFLSAKGAKQRRNQMDAIANTPGIDSRATTADALGDIEFNTPQAKRVASTENTFNQEELNRMMELAVPGYGGLQGQRAKNAGSLLRGELPPDVEALVKRKAAARSVAGGFGGSGMARNLTLRDLGLTSLDAMTTGNQFTTSLIGSSPVANLARLSEFTGLTPRELIAMRSRERFDKLDRLTAAAGIPNSNEIWGKGLQDMGSSRSGMGMGSLMGGG
jgi:hypothetical protein